MNRILRFRYKVILFVCLTSCSTREFREVPLDKVPERVRSTGSQIARDITVSFTKEEGADYLLDKYYLTPRVHGSIVSNRGMYAESYDAINTMIEHVISYSLFQVKDNGKIKVLRYSLKVQSPLAKFVELKLHLNIHNQLAAFYLYYTSLGDRIKRKNILPEFRSEGF
ncbi:MAG TPA: hypothetical protein DEP18_04325 [Flavobacteriales bacterium]|nr:hypothetical protein [Flavobacteriales bacterium]HCA82991.1 hypothetical protein [Flavobacteriales bacterium]HRE73601.1 hypothetical protein [Flavobacteriales bacterium]HRE95344.1 hypothetical protein [Flavobacteriales bacterium]HRJ37266.1 hypothetical protein [Flavobacteriales bacterium]